MAEQYDQRPPTAPQARSPHGTSLMPMQALGGPPPELPPTGYPPPFPPPEQPRPRPARSKSLDYTLKALGLLGVALVSGFLWWLTHNQPPAGDQTAPPQHPAGRYQFVPFVPASSTTDCAGHATGQVQNYLKGHPCVSMSRSLYTTTLTDGDKVITSVAVVRMPTGSQAKALDRISKGNATGHVEDLVEEGYPVPNGPKSLEDGGYESRPAGATEVIVETEFLNGAEDNPHTTLANQATIDTLRGVSTDALNQRLGL